MCEICSKLAIKTPGVVLVSLLLTLNKFHLFLSVSIVKFEQVNLPRMDCPERKIDKINVNLSSTIAISSLHRTPPLLHLKAIDLSNLES